MNCLIFPVVNCHEYLVWILDDYLFFAFLFCRMWMVSSTTPRTATAHRSAFASPLSAGVVKVTKALRGFDTTPSTSTRPSLPTSSARCSSRECQHHTHTHTHVKYITHPHTCTYNTKWTAPYPSTPAAIADLSCPQIFGGHPKIICLDDVFVSILLF